MSVFSNLAYCDGYNEMSDSDNDMVNVLYYMIYCNNTLEGRRQIYHTSIFMPRMMSVRSSSREVFIFARLRRSIWHFITYSIRTKT